MATKQDICEQLVAAGMLPSCFDYALPQGWLNQFKGEDYERARSRHVWAYREGDAFGDAVDIIFLHEMLQANKGVAP